MLRKQQRMQRRLLMKEKNNWKIIRSLWIHSTKKLMHFQLQMKKNLLLYRKKQPKILMKWLWLTVKKLNY